MKKNTFAIKDGNIGSELAQTEHTIEDEESYWMVAYRLGQTPKVSVFEKQPSPEAGKYKVRIFADGAYHISIAGVQLASTIQADVSGGYAVSACTDLAIADTEIDLCAQATPGLSYLITYVQGGNYYIAEE